MGSSSGSLHQLGKCSWCLDMGSWAPRTALVGCTGRSWELDTVMELVQGLGSSLGTVLVLATDIHWGSCLDMVLALVLVMDTHWGSCSGKEPGMGRGMVPVPVLGMVQLRRSAVGPQCWSRNCSRRQQPIRAS